MRLNLENLADGKEGFKAFYIISGIATKNI
jgi:hypothetical protein